MLLIVDSDPFRDHYILPLRLPFRFDHVENVTKSEPEASLVWRVSSVVHVVCRKAQLRQSMWWEHDFIDAPNELA